MEASWNGSFLAHPASATGTPGRPSSPAPGLTDWRDRIALAADRTHDWLLGRQSDQGYWVAELQGDTILESETILLLAFLGREQSDRARRLAQYLLEQQLPSGGWAMYPGGKMAVSGSVEAYFALKLTGHDPSSEPMQRARRAILAHGGADAVNSYTRFFLALLGQISYEHCPAVPPQLALLPKWFPVNLYSVSAWSRTIIVPLSIVWACRPVRQIDRSLGIHELFLKAPEDWPPLRCPGLPGGTGLCSWDRLFRTVDRGLKFLHRHRALPFHRRALRAALRWTVDRFRGSDGLGAIYPPIVWSILALRCLGYSDDSAEVTYCHRQLDDLLMDDPRTGAMRVQPCKSPVWDTAIVLRSLAASGEAIRQPAVSRGVEWLLDQQVRAPGDWSQTVEAEPAGWCFEFHNDYYPDADDTAMVLMAIQDGLGEAARGCDGERRTIRQTTVAGLAEARQQASLVDRATESLRKGLAWMAALQNDDGGWGAFDRNNNRQFLCYVPFADHNAMIDPSTPDLTGRALEAMGRLGHRIGEPAVDRAVEYLRREQQPDGSWFGRWGVNYIYGTWQSLTGLAEVGLGAEDPMMVAGAQWLLAHQQPGGGWGESPDSYADPSLRGQGPATASQTAWALLGLLATGHAGDLAVARGVQFLLQHQRPDGTWAEEEFTGTGFPRVFYLRYHYYPIYFPLLALRRYQQALASSARRALAPDVPAEVRGGR